MRGLSVKKKKKSYSNVLSVREPNKNEIYEIQTVLIRNAQFAISYEIQSTDKSTVQLNRYNRIQLALCAV